MPKLPPAVAFLLNATDDSLPFRLIEGPFTEGRFFPGTHRLELARPGERIRDDIRRVLTRLEAEGTVSSAPGKVIGSGAAGAAVAGPLGALAGALLHAGDRDVVFEADLVDGRRIRGQAPEASYRKMRVSLYGS